MHADPTDTETGFHPARAFWRTFGVAELTRWQRWFVLLFTMAVLTGFVLLLNLVF